LVWPGFNLAIGGARLLAFEFGGRTGWKDLSKNRYEHVHVRLFQAIPGLQHFWTGPSNRFMQTWEDHPFESQLFEANKGTRTTKKGARYGKGPTKKRIQ